MVVNLVSPFNSIMPIVSFLFVFVLVYALIVKSKLLEGNAMVPVFISLLIASFFIVNTNLINFVKISTSWVIVLFVVVFFVMLILSFVGGDAVKVFTGNKSITWVIVFVIIVTFVITSSYIYNWTINWNVADSWLDKEWFGMLVLAIVAIVVSFIITKTKKS